MNIALLGSGHTATVLGRLFRNNSHRITQVWSRNPAHAQLLASELDAGTAEAITDLQPGAELYLLAISDDALEEVAKQWPLPDVLVAHTAGAVPLSVLDAASNRRGVFYPLQRLRKEALQPQQIPILVDGNTPEVQQLLEQLARSIGCTVAPVNDVQRLRLHTAAVISSNFSNHLFALTQDWCDKNGVDFALLLPLLEEVVQGLHHQRAADQQTGPAWRGDRHTLARHQELLQDETGLLRVYEILSESIGEMYRKKEELRTPNPQA
ncbi:MAG TPA: DUF2520 domain-containing protein [Lacibacter sp.]|nr:DUF2520 domain-containing protein [Lacibacter sp.]HMO89736.1 DUF2520 domain-containing protein [Lacibacter sp.]HMP87647.1 DUF2520 domain-containing protein [Lacibacter sp.]